MFDITRNLELELLKTGINPNIVLEIDGIDEIFGAVRILKYVRIGDPGLLIGNDWVIGGFNEVAEQDDIISLQGTSTSIQQQLRPDQGSVSSISSIGIQLIDKRLKMTRYISPGIVVDDILARRANVFIGMKNTAYPEDYIKIFSGIIDQVDAGAGYVKLNIAHPDQKKRQQIFFKKDANLTGAMDNSQTTVPISLGDAIFPEPYTGPDATIDETIKYYVRIDDEVMRYEGTSVLGLTSVTRGALGTTQVAHDSGAKVELIYVLEGNVVDLALKTMLSGKNEAYVTDVPVQSFNSISPTVTVANSIFFRNLDVFAEYGIVAGDFVTVTGATAGGNNFSNATVISVQTDNDGSYIVMDSSVTLVDELDSGAVCSFRSQYDTWGIGLGLDPRDVDVTEHEYWKALLLGSISMRIYLKSDINGVDLIHKEIYSPIGAYSVPRQGKCSMGYHIGPVPRGEEIPVLNKDNVREPSKIVIHRTTNRNFYNTILYQFDELANDDRFVSGVVVVNEDSKNRIPMGTKAFKQVAKGLRTDLGASAVAEFTANRMLGRYKFAAEYFEKVKTFFKKGFNIEPGDIVILDGEDLKISNTKQGDRNRPARLMEVTNKTLDLKGNCELDLTDTNYDLSERFGLISPSSVVVSGTTTYAIIEDSYGELYPGNEKRKWDAYVDLPVLIRDEEFNYEIEGIFVGFDPNNRYKMLFDPPLATAVSAGDIIDIVPYSDSTDPTVNDKYKAIHCHLSPIVDVVTGASDLEFDVDSGDVDKFQVGFPIIVHSEDFSDASDEVYVDSIIGTTITVTATLGFTPDNTHKISMLGFPDGSHCYRYI